MLAKDLVLDYFDDLESRIREIQTYFSLGFEDLDQLVKIPRNTGALVAIGARPAMGKTTFMLSILEKLIEQKRKILFFSLDMSETRLVGKFLFQVAEVCLIKDKLLNLCKKDWENICSALQKAQDWDFYVDGTSINIEQMEEKINKIKPEVVFIDYLQMLEYNSELNRGIQIEDIMLKLKRIAKEKGIVIIINSQLSRAIESRADKRPYLSDFRSSGAIENISDVVMFIYRHDYYNFRNEEDYELNKGKTEIIVAKNKFGSVGTVYMTFRPEIPKFYPYKEIGFDEF